MKQPPNFTIFGGIHNTKGWWTGSVRLLFRNPIYLRYGHQTVEKRKNTTIKLTYQPLLYLIFIWRQQLFDKNYQFFFIDSLSNFSLLKVTVFKSVFLNYLIIISILIFDAYFLFLSIGQAGAFYVCKLMFSYETKINYCWLCCDNRNFENY